MGQSVKKTMFSIHWVLKWRRQTMIVLIIFIVILTFCCILYYKSEIDHELKRVKNIPRKQILKIYENNDRLHDGDHGGVVGPSVLAREDSPKREPFRVVHLDLKGAPPKLSFLRVLFPMIAAAGANALLIEYEDMFPFERNIQNISARNAYTKTQVKEILSLAKENKLEVIPLVQTFGHLEFALKLQEFRYLRELDAFPQEVCPSNPDSVRVLIFEMIDQVMEAHPDARYLHIGCDEVFHLAACARCTRRRVGARALFTDHVKQIANRVRNTYGAIPLVWDDMFRQWSPMDLADSGLGDLVEPVVWVYISDIINLVPHYVWHMYGRTFPNIWVASAFKGAFGETNVLPNIGRHLDNHLAWIRFMRSKQPEPVRNFRGVVLTGWSRYDHFAVLCELLPSALPSLLLNLLVVSRSLGAQRGAVKLTSREEESRLLEDEIFHEWKSILACPYTFPKKSLKPFTKDPFVASVNTCSFPGSNLFASILRFLDLKHELDAFKKRLTIKMGWMTDYNVKHNFSSPWRVIEGFSAIGASGEQMRRHLGDFKNEISGVLTQYFDNFTVQEWVELHVVPMEASIKYLDDSAKGLMARHIWPRRPLT